MLLQSIQVQCGNEQHAAMSHLNSFYQFTDEKVLSATQACLRTYNTLSLCPTGTSLSEDSVDVEALSNNTNGVVFFNGGTYSAGPDFIGAFGCMRNEIISYGKLQLFPSSSS